VNAIFDVLTQNIVPIFIVAGLGYWLRRGLSIPTRPISSVVFNVFSPALVFVSLVNSRLGGDELLRLIVFAVLSISAMGAIAFFAGKLLRMSRADTIGLILVVMFVNGGNYGLTLNQLRYGEAGLSRAVVYFVVSTIFVYTVGVFLASMGRQSRRHAFVGLARVPAIYAVVAALVVYLTGFRVPGPLMSALEITADGAIPAMLVVLGMNMASMDGLASWRLVLPGTVLRMVVAPLVAVGLAAAVGLRGLGYATSIIEASMPTAVITTVLATEYDVHQSAVTKTVVLTTLVSPLTLALIITLLAL
jgi:malate permease and related proteins